MTTLTKGESRALNLIIDTCDDLDDYLFTRREDAIAALVDHYGDAQVAGGYYTNLLKKGYIEEEGDDGYGVGVWVNPL